MKKIAIRSVCALLMMVGMLLLAGCDKPRNEYTPVPGTPVVVLTKVTVGDFTYADNGDHLSVFSYNGTNADVTVPGQVVLPAEEGEESRTLTVTEVGAYAFADNTVIETVT